MGIRLFIHSLFSGYTYKQEKEVEKETEKYVPLLEIRKYDGDILRIDKYIKYLDRIKKIRVAMKRLEYFTDFDYMKNLINSEDNLNVIINFVKGEIKKLRKEKNFNEKKRDELLKKHNLKLKDIR